MIAPRTASELMQRDVIIVEVDTPILDVHRLFVEEEIHGAPVIDDEQRVRGVISTMDLLRVVRDELEPGAGATSSTYFRDQLPYSGPDWGDVPEDLQNRIQHLTAADAMTKEIVSVSPHASAAQVAAKMLQHHVHRVLVIEDGALVGVISSFDLLRAVAEQSPRAEHTGYAR
jgi:CBS domain-containing protein